MSTKDDLEERFRSLEREVYAETNNHPPMKSADPYAQKGKGDSIPQIPDLESAKSALTGVVSWVNSLSGAARIAAIAIVGIIAFSIISFLLKLVWQAISLGVMALVIYVLYKVFFAPNPPDSQS